MEPKSVVKITQKVEVTSPKKKLRRGNRIFDFDFGASFLIPHFNKNPQLPGKFTNAKFKSSQMLTKPSWYKGNPLSRQEPIN